MYDDSTIRDFIAANRQIALIQRQRWDSVDPTRLLEACDLLEQLLDAGVAPVGKRGLQLDQAQIVHFDVMLVRYAATPMAAIGRGYEVEIKAMVPGMDSSAASLAAAALGSLAGLFPICIRVEQS